MINKEIKDYLNSLRTATEEICELAIERRAEFEHAAVNWADFHCVSAECYVEDIGTFGYRVYIEEANPNTRDVIEFISEELISRGFDMINIDIVFEW